MPLLAEIAQLLGVEVIGDATTPITSVAPLDEAGPTDITWAEDAKRINQAAKSRAGAVIAPQDTPGFGPALLLVDNPRRAFVEVLRFFAPPADVPAGIDPAAHIASSAQLAEGVKVGPGASIADGVRIGRDSVVGAGVHIGRETEIGAGCLIHPGVVIRDRVHIGDRVIIQPGAVIGSDGFGYVQGAEGHHQKMPHIGTVILEDDVEIGANTTVDRGTCGATIIGRGSKVDNLVQVGHNVRIGEHCLVVALTGLAGSSSMGDGVTMAGQSALAGHLHVGDGSLIYARGLVDADIPPGSAVSGIPARPHREQLRMQALQRRLPEALPQLAQLKAQVAELEAALARLTGQAPKESDTP